MAVAYGRFAKEDGMVVDVRKRYTGVSMFNCQFWSDFTDEKERFFIGSLTNFQFKSIHNVSTNEDYQAFTRAIDILQVMIIGFPYQHGRVSSIDVKCLAALLTISDVSNASDDDERHNQQIRQQPQKPKVRRSEEEKGEEIVVPDYVKRFFHNFCNGVKEIKINMLSMNCDDQYAESNLFGHLKLKSLFWKNDSIELIKFVKLFKNTINVISIFDNINPEKGFEKSIELNDEFEMELIKLMIFINLSKAFKNRFKYLIIINPKIDNLDGYIIEKNKYFPKNYGWMLEKRQYYDIKRNSKCNESIYFFPIV